MVNTKSMSWQTKSVPKISVAFHILPTSIYLTWRDKIDFTIVDSLQNLAFIITALPWGEEAWTGSRSEAEWSDHGLERHRLLMALWWSWSSRFSELDCNGVAKLLFSMKSNFKFPGDVCKLFWQIDLIVLKIMILLFLLLWRWGWGLNKPSDHLFLAFIFLEKLLIPSNKECQQKG